MSGELYGGQDPRALEADGRTQTEILGRPAPLPVVLVEVVADGGRARHAAGWRTDGRPLWPVCGRPAHTWTAVFDLAAPANAAKVWPTRCANCRRLLGGRDWPAPGRPS